MSFAAALLALAALSSTSPIEGTVRVRVLESFHPKQAQIDGPSTIHRFEARGTSLLVDDEVAQQPFRLPEGDWRIAFPVKAQPRSSSNASGRILDAILWAFSRPALATRRYTGSLSVRAADGELALVLELPLERYVAEVVASETKPNTPEEALRAQAVVVRSYVLAQGPRHADADVCDLAHCQLLRRGGGVPEAHRAAARAATLATAGRVLVLASGAIAETPFHAACGGHTADPGEVFGSAVTGAASVEDTGCPAKAWDTAVPRARFRAALGTVFSRSRLAEVSPADISPEGLELVKGQGGYVVRVLAPEGRAARGDAVARALDKAMGWGVVRSGRFTFETAGDTVWVHGAGLGHGLGLCQAGAALRAANGQRYSEILRHYFPDTVLR
jgi:stage II sporulation protein D